MQGAGRGVLTSAGYLGPLLPQVDVVSRAEVHDLRGLSDGTSSFMGHRIPERDLTHRATRFLDF